MPGPQMLSVYQFKVVLRGVSPMIWRRFSKKQSTSQNDTLHLAQEFLGRMRSDVDPAEIAKLSGENMEWEAAGDTGVLHGIGQKSGRAAIIDFVNDSRP